MDNARTIKLLQQLVDTCRDGQNGYRDAADHVTDSHLREFFNEQSLARAGFAGGGGGATIGTVGVSVRPTAGNIADEFTG